MRQSGHWKGDNLLSQQSFQALLNKTIDGLDIGQAVREVEPFVKNPEVLALWSHDFFREVALKIQFV